MGMTVKTIVKMYMLFAIYQLCINIFVGVVPVYLDLDDTNQEYLDWLSTNVNGEISTTTESQSLLDNFKSHLQTADLFNASIIDKFLGVLTVIGSIIWFMIQLALSILFTPSLLFQVVFYNFIASSSSLFLLSLLINVVFYLTIFYIVFKSRVSS